MDIGLIVLLIILIRILPLAAEATSALVLTSNTSVVYTVVGLPDNGTLYANDTTLIQSTPYQVVASLYYRPDDPYDFSGPTCVPPLDTFEVDIVYFPSLANETRVTVNVCIADTQNLPISNAIDVYSNEEQPFRLNVTDYDDRAGSDGVLSSFSFHELDLVTLSTGSSVVFNTSVITSLGNITTCEDNVTVSTGVSYELEEFCFASNYQEGYATVQYYAIDKAGGESNGTGLIRINSKKLVVNATSEVYTTSTSTTRVAFVLYSEAFSRVQFDYEITILQVPKYGLVYGPNEVVIVQGSRLSPPNATLRYAKDSGYYNRLYFPNYANGYTTYETGNTLYDEGPDVLRYQASNDSFQVTSTIGQVNFIVDKTIIEELEACALYAKSVWPDESCISYGEESSYIPIYMGGTDGRDLDFPGYYSVVIALPEHGVLYHNIGDNFTVYKLGEEVEVGDIVRPLTGFFAPLLYRGNDGYFNRFRYDTSPDAYISLVNETQTYICGNATSTCEDSMYFKIISGVNSSLESEITRYDVVVTRTVTNQLTVCDISGYSPWNYSCISVGYENNTLYGTYFTPIHLNVNNTFGQAITYVITSVPARGKLFLSDNDTSTWIQVGDVITPKADTSEPDFFYVGDENYFNDVSYQYNTLLLYVDLKNVPFGTCVEAVTEGCPDEFTFYAQTAGGARISNPGTYNIFIHGTISNGTLTGPERIIFAPEVPYYFSGSDAISYNDPDGDAFRVSVTFKMYDGYIGFLGEMSNLSFPFTNTCFNTSDGCLGEVQFYAVPSDVQRVFDGLFYKHNESISEAESDNIYITIVKRHPDGITTNDTFIFQEEDTVIVLDIEYYSRIATIDEEDDVYDGLDDYFEDQIGEENCKQTNLLIIIFGTLVSVLLTANLFMLVYLVYLRRVAEARALMASGGGGAPSSSSSGDIKKEATRSKTKLNKNEFSLEQREESSASTMFNMEEEEHPQSYNPKPARPRRGFATQKKEIYD